MTVAVAAASLIQISSDTFTNTTSQHATEVEPDTFSFGPTIVMATQAGRFSNGGASDIAWSTSIDGGNTWTSGTLPGLTVFTGGTYDRVSDPSVSYDPKHNVWIITGLAISTPGTAVNGTGISVNRSTDGGLTWANASNAAVATGTQNFDKDWVVCDTVSTSPNYGNCYVEWDDNGNGNRILMSTSTDGGLTWGAPVATANSATGLGGQPLTLPNGTVVVPIANANETAILAFTSTNGGTSWTAPVTVSTVRMHTDAGKIRSGPLPSAAVDANGKVYVVWQDCRFITRCAANDIVMSTSSNGTTWSAVTRIPIDTTAAKVDHFIPGIAADPTTSSPSVHLGLAFYYYPVAACSPSTCQLDVGYVSSTNGGTTWSTKTQLAGPLTLSWLANTTQGSMVGDYISTSFANGKAFPAFALATAKTGSTFHEAINTVTGGLSASRGDLPASSDGATASSATEAVIAGAPATAR
jgi:hypothetical protein